MEIVVAVVVVVFSFHVNLQNILPVKINRNCLSTIHFFYRNYSFFCNIEKLRKKIFKIKFDVMWKAKWKKNIFNFVWTKKKTTMIDSEWNGKENGMNFGEKKFKKSTFSIYCQKHTHTHTQTYKRTINIQYILVAWKNFGKSKKTILFWFKRNKNLKKKCHVNYLTLIFNVNEWEKTSTFFLMLWLSMFNQKKNRLNQKHRTKIITKTEKKHTHTNWKKFKYSWVNNKNNKWSVIQCHYTGQIRIDRIENQTKL